MITLDQEKIEGLLFGWATTKLVWVGHGKGALGSGRKMKTKDIKKVKRIIRRQINEEKLETTRQHSLVINLLAKQSKLLREIADHLVALEQEFHAPQPEDVDAQDILDVVEEFAARENLKTAEVSSTSMSRDTMEELASLFRLLSAGKRVTIVASANNAPANNSSSAPQDDEFDDVSMGYLGEPLMKEDVFGKIDIERMSPDGGKN